MAKEFNTKIGPFLINTKIRFMRIEDLCDWQAVLSAHGTNALKRLGNLVMEFAKDGEPPYFEEKESDPQEGDVTLRQWAAEQGLGHLFA